MKRRVALGAALVLAAISTAFPVRAQTSTPSIEHVPNAIVRLLDDYGRAFRTKNATLLQAGSTGPIRDELTTSVRNAKEVPFAAYVARVTTQFSGNLASPRIRERYPRKQVAVYHVIEETRLDVESGPSFEEGAFTFVRDRAAAGDSYDGWRLVSKDDLAVLGFFSPYHVWDAGPVRIARSAHFALLAHPDTIDSVRPLLDVLERAYAHDQKTWPLSINDRYVVVVPSTTDELGRIIHETVDLGKFVAFVAAGGDPEKGFAPTYPRMFVHLGHIKRYPPADQQDIFQHELIHAVTRPVAGPHMPAWVEEGLANALGGNGGRPSLARQGPLPDEFPSDDTFVTESVRSIQIAYDRSQVAIETLRDRFGPQGVARFYKTLGAARIVPGTDDYQVRLAVSKSLEWSMDEWLAAWRKQLS